MCFKTISSMFAVTFLIAIGISSVSNAQEVSHSNNHTDTLPVTTTLPMLGSLSSKLAKPFPEVSEISLQGILVQGGMIRGYLPSESQPKLNGKTVYQNPKGFFVAGFGRDEESPAVLEWFESKMAFSLPIKVKKREYAVQRVDGVPQKTVTPSADKLARIRKETALVKAARKQIMELDYFTQGFLIPVAGRKTGVFGSQRIYNGVPKRPHYGVDYAAPTGTPVVAPADALVSLTHDDMYYSGGTMIMDHGYGFSSTFIHLSEILVEEGDQVKKGDVVAKVGAGGRATGPHLDWRINWFDVRMDPELVLELEAIEPD